MQMLLACVILPLNITVNVLRMTRWIFFFVELLSLYCFVFSTLIFPVLQFFMGTFVAVESYWLEKTFQNVITPLCSYANFIESTICFFLYCTHFDNQRLTLLIESKNITMFIFEKHSVTLSKSILETTTYCKFIISSHWFDTLFFNQYFLKALFSLNYM